MSKFNNEMALKLAWQTAYGLRTCPDEDTLFSEVIDANLRKHLSICHVCRDKRAMDPEERKAWKVLQANFAGAAMRPATDIVKQSGQVWMLAKRFGGWRDDGRFVNPPSVLLLEKLAPDSWKVVQLYYDKRLMGDGDVPLSGCFGFAEAWNCYSLREDRFNCWLGVVGQAECGEVVAASMVSHDPAPEGSVLSFFRMAEVEVGEFLAEWERAKEEVFELVPGLKLAIDSAKGFVLDITADTLALLRGTFNSAPVFRSLVPRSAAPKLSGEQKKLIQEHCPVLPMGMNIADDTLTMTLKWLQEKPDVLPDVQLIVNGEKFNDIIVDDTGRNIVSIRCTHERIAQIELQGVAQIRFTVNAEKMSILLQSEELP